MSKRPPKGSFEYLLHQAASGGEEEKLALCKRLADRLLIVPILGELPKQAVEQRINVLTRDSNDGRWVPVFSSKATFEHWREVESFSGSQISVLGADLCLVLGTEIGIEIDPCSPFNVKLSAVELVESEVTRIDLCGAPLTTKDESPMAPPDVCITGAARPTYSKSSGAESRLRLSKAKLL